METKLIKTTVTAVKDIELKTVTHQQKPHEAGAYYL